MKIKIRKFKEEDAAAVASIIRRANRVTLKNYYLAELIEAQCRRNRKIDIIRKSKGRNFFVAVEGASKVMGVMGIRDDEITNFFVDPNFQGVGIGRKLFERILQYAKKYKYKQLSVRSSLYAVGIYKKLGFKNIRKVWKDREGIKYYDVLMTRPL